MYLQDQNLIWVAKGDDRVCLNPKMANRHGLIAGATGTGKTVTLKVLAEAFSDMGTPVFLADIKGDVSGMCQPGVANENVDKRVAALGVEGFSYSGYPVRFFDVFGERGIPVRTTISDMGPELLARFLGLNDTQTGVLNVVFKVADDQGLLLIDTKDLRSMLQWCADHRDELQTGYGNIATQSVAAIQRSMVTLEGSGGDIFFGEPALDINDWMALDENGRGIINLLHCVKLVQSPVLYSTFLLWMLSDLYEKLPEAGDPEKPKMVFFFDEAHLLFDNAPKALLDKVEQVARLIRSKGVGIYFITQQPDDIPDTVLAQLGNKIQHALRAYTPKDQKSVKAAAASFRANPAFDSEQALGELGTGEALISMLDEKGIPTVVQRAMVLPPRSFMGVADEATVQSMIKGSGLYGKYAQAVDRESAYEDLQQKAQDEQAAAQKATEDAQKAAEEAEKQKQAEKDAAQQQKQTEKEQQREEREHEKEKERKERERSRVVNRVFSSAASSVGRQLGNSIMRGLFGTRK